MRSFAESAALDSKDFGDTLQPQPPPSSDPAVSSPPTAPRPPTHASVPDRRAAPPRVIPRPHRSPGAQWLARHAPARGLRALPQAALPALLAQLQGSDPVGMLAPDDDDHDDELDELPGDEPVTAQILAPRKGPKRIIVISDTHMRSAFTTGLAHEALETLRHRAIPVRIAGKPEFLQLGQPAGVHWRRAEPIPEQLGNSAVVCGHWRFGTCCFPRPAGLKGL